MLVNHKKSNYDLVIIGGGINGTAIAADAAGRGLNVLLCEQADLASGTSSTSSKLIHGGLRYLEQYAFKMVRHSLHEREILLKQAPHLVHPIRFILPLNNNTRSELIIRLGLWLYDFLSGNTTLPHSKSIVLKNNTDINPLNSSFKKAFVFSDCYVNDARLVILNALRAAKHHARVLTYTKLIAAQYTSQEWTLTLQNQISKITETVTTRVLINATGPWLDQVNHHILHMQAQSQYKLTLVKGSHVVLPKLYDGNHGYLLQNKDKRVIFVIPYHQFTMVGTTDVPFHDSLDNIEISTEEINYLIESINQYFYNKIKTEQIISSWSGVRALLDDKNHNLSSVSREYKIELINSSKIAPLINVFGGKLTTHRLLAEEVMSHLKPFFKNMKPNWTANAPLPGGDINNSFEEFSKKLQNDFKFLPETLCQRYANYYGTLCYQFLKNKNTLEDLGHHFGHHLYQTEVDYLVQHEWAMSAADILERRTKIGLLFSKSQKLELELSFSSAYY